MPLRLEPKKLKKGLRQIEVARKIRESKARKQQNFMKFISKIVVRKTGETLKPWFCCMPNFVHLHEEMKLGHFNKASFGGKDFFIWSHRDLFNLAEKYEETWTCSDKGLYFIAYEEIKSVFKDSGILWQEVRKAWGKKASLPLRKLKSIGISIPIGESTTSLR